MHSASFGIPGNFFGLLSTEIARTVEMISRENSIRRVPRTSLERLYIAHTRRIATTVITISVCLSNKQTTWQRTIGRPEKENKHPFIDDTEYFTLEASINRGDIEFLGYQGAHSWLTDISCDGKLQGMDVERIRTSMIHVEYTYQLATGEAKIPL